MIIITRNYRKSEKESIEMVERKGLGHPDTLCDLIAEEFSNNYSKYCIENFGCILNHWVDKILLSGGTTELDFGKTKINKPITAYLFGKAISQVGKEAIDIEAIFKKSIAEIFSGIFLNQKILDNINYVIDINSGIGKEHSKEFYSPNSVEEIKNSWETLRSNDTIICSGYAPLSFVEKLSIGLENFINSANFKSFFPETGWDVKIMITRVRDSLDITICLPFIASMTPSYKYYSEKLEAAKEKIKEKIKLEIKKSNFPSSDFSLNINTKDKGEFVYLTAFGTALDKGDYGAVGRGNKYCGVIAINRESNIEAVPGKNPTNHSGKLYTILAHDLADRINKLTSVNVCVNISARNGDDIGSPAFVAVKHENAINASKRNEINDIIKNGLKQIYLYPAKIIDSDVIESHISRKSLMD